MSAADDRCRVDWRALAADASRYGRAGAGIVAQRAREREAELLSDLAAAIAAEREAAAKVCDKAAAESVQDERDADAKDDNELSALACEARRTAVYLAAAIRARGAS